MHRHPGTTLLAACKLAVFALYIAPAMLVQLALLRVSLPAAGLLAVFTHRFFCRLLNMHVVAFGQPQRAGPVLFVSNHTSWMDIVALTSLLPVSFVAKAEVASWPLFGWLAKLQRTVFVDRRPSRIGDQRDEIRRRLNAGDHLVLFPEGTSNDGNRVLPFKSALFAVVQPLPEDRPITLQPVSIAYTRLDGMPIGRRLRHLFAWYGDMELVPHLWRVLGAGRVTVEVEFHRPVPAELLANRKALAVHCHTVVSGGVADALTGRRTGRAEAAETSPLPAVEWS